MSESTVKENIVVIGGGYGGVQAAQKLASKLGKSYQIILIERKSHFYHNIGGLRALVEEGFEAKVLIPYTHVFDKYGEGKLVHGTVTKLNTNDLTIRKADGGEENITFKVAVVATGSDYPRPAKFDGKNKDEGINELLRQREALKNAKKVLIIGAGPVGIELTGEILEVYKDKEITLVHGEDNVLSSRFPNKLRDSLTRQLKSLNVNLILNDKVDAQRQNIGDGLSKLTITTEKGQTIESDIQFFVVGAKPNTSLIESLNGSLIDDRHLVKVKPTFQLDLDGYNHIFAIGDITNIPETKLSFRAGMHADIVAKNIVSFLKEKKLQEYKPGKEAIFVPIGRKGGAGLLPISNLVVGPWMVSGIKGKGLFVNQLWKLLNATPEK